MLFVAIGFAILGSLTGFLFWVSLLNYIDYPKSRFKGDKRSLLFMLVICSSFWWGFSHSIQLYKLGG